jgi:hypothetical protein
VERSLQLIGVVIDEVAAVQVHELGRADQAGEDQTEYLLLSLGLGLGLDHQLLLYRGRREVDRTCTPAEPLPVCL